MNELILIFILGHFVADFWIQTDLLNKEKKEGSFKAQIKHSFSHFIAYIILLNVFGVFKLQIMGFIILISIFHLIIDISKVGLENYFEDKELEKLYQIILGKKASLFILDQILHMLSIIFTLYLYQTYSVLDSLKAFYNIMVEGNHNLESNIQFLSVSIIIVLISHGSAYFIESIISNKNQPHNNNELAAGSSLSTGHPDLDEFFNSLNFSEKEFIVERVIEKTNGGLLSKVTNKYNFFNESQKSIGKYIGIIERLLIVILVVKSAFTGIVIIAAFKTFARHKQLEEKAFAEYYLLGSLISILLAFVFGYMLTRLI